MSRNTKEYNIGTSPLAYSARLGLLTLEQEYELSDIIQSNAPEEERIEARNKLVMHNLRAAYDRAKRYCHAAQTLDDSLQIMYWGMIEAAERFTREKAGGAKFISYAVWYMKKYGTLSMKNSHNWLSAPSGAMKKYRLVLAYMDEHPGATKEEVVSALGGAISKYCQIGYAYDVYMATRGSVSLDSTGINGMSGEFSEFYDMVPGEDARESSDFEINADAGVILAIAERELKPLHYAAFAMRFYLDDLPLVEIGKKMGRTRERVRQMVEESITAVRRAMARMSEKGEKAPPSVEYDQEKVDDAVRKGLKERPQWVGNMIYCAICGKRFRAHNPTQRYCSVVCSEEAQSLMNKKRRAESR